MLLCDVAEGESSRPLYYILVGAPMAANFKIRYMQTYFSLVSGEVCGGEVNLGCLPILVAFLNCFSTFLFVLIESTCQGVLSQPL